MSADSLTYQSATKIHEALTPPVACASCNGQYPDRRHVDFSAGYDGVGLDPATQTHIAGGKTVFVDDLIICDECLTAAAAVLGLGDLSEAEARHEHLASLYADSLERLNGALAYIKTLEAAAVQRMTPEAKTTARKARA